VGNAATTPDKQAGSDGASCDASTNAASVMARALAAKGRSPIGVQSSGVTPLLKTVPKSDTGSVYTIVGASHQHAIVSLMEQRSGFVLLKKVANKSAKDVEQAVCAMLKPYPARVKTITSDNGKELANHQVWRANSMLYGNLLTRIAAGNAAATKT
jgi:hypothetical protein